MKRAFQLFLFALVVCAAVLGEIACLESTPGMMRAMISMGNIGVKVSGGPEKPTVGSVAMSVKPSQSAEKVRDLGAKIYIPDYDVSGSSITQMTAPAVQATSDRLEEVTQTASAAKASAPSFASLSSSIASVNPYMPRQMAIESVGPERSAFSVTSNPLTVDTAAALTMLKETVTAAAMTNSEEMSLESQGDMIDWRSKGSEAPQESDGGVSSLDSNNLITNLRFDPGLISGGDVFLGNAILQDIADIVGIQENDPVTLEETTPDLSSYLEGISPYTVPLAVGLVSSAVNSPALVTSLPDAVLEQPIQSWGIVDVLEDLVPVQGNSLGSFATVFPGEVNGDVNSEYSQRAAAAGDLLAEVKSTPAPELPEAWSNNNVRKSVETQLMNLMG